MGINTGSILIDLFTGVSTGMFLFVVSAGLTIIFGTLRILNFAHGCLFMLGAYIAWSLTGFFEGVWGAYWIAALLSGIVMVVVALVIEVFLLRHIYQSEVLYQLLTTFGLIFVFTGASQEIWGTVAKTIATPTFLTGSIVLADTVFPIYYFFLILFGIFMSVVLWIFLYKTNLGKSARAAAMDREVTETLGINVPFVFSAVFCIGSFTAALAGSIGIGLRSITLNLGLDMVLICFVIVIVGGVRSLKGTFVAALILGLSDSFVGHYFQALSMFVPYLLLAVVLLLRPEGLFRR
jgi:branched-subunit amino acid ABC-type transport system permease component